MIAPWEIRVGDVRERLREIPSGVVQCCATSPPYWGLRDYGTAQWDGGDAECDHDQRRREKDPDSKQATNAGSARDSVAGKQACRKCGAKRIDRQIGQEPTPDAYVQTMVEVFREVRRVLHDSGTVWLNVGDSYAGPNQGYSGDDRPSNTKGSIASKNDGARVNGQVRRMSEGLKTKDLCLIPWRLAIALQADGWWVRSVICWAKKSCMPESVTDRPTNSWEPIFLLAKSSRYFYDAEAVKENFADDRMGNPGGGGAYSVGSRRGDRGALKTGKYNETGTTSGRNQRNVWHLGPEPYAEAHFATFPTEIPRRAIKAGTSEKGCCPKCRAPWVRVVERTKMEWDESARNKSKRDAGLATSIGGTMTKAPESRTIGWKPGCSCGGEPIPCTVLDQFAGAGTTGLVASQLGRAFVGIELNPAYAEMARRRITDDAPLFNANGATATQ